MKQPRKLNDLLYDVGMHKGEDTDYFLRKGFKVIAFEADPDLLAHCRRKFSAEIENGRLTIVEGAIVERSPNQPDKLSVQFFKNRDNSVWGTVASDWARRNEMSGTTSEIINVPVVNFAHCLEKYGIPHYLKIDIEGMDTVCLKALLAFDEKPDYISIESEKVSFCKLVEELDLMSQLGYTGFKAVQQNNIALQVEPNPSLEGSYSGHQFQAGASGLFGKDLPGKWKNRRQITNEYRITFLLYKLFGDYGKLRRFNRFLTGGKRGKLFSLFFGRTIPFWYDTHARHRSVVPK